MLGSYEDCSLSPMHRVEAFNALENGFVKFHKFEVEKCYYTGKDGTQKEDKRTVRNKFYEVFQ